MTNAFVNTAIASSQTTRTENGALAYKTTGNELLDFFSVAGAMRTRRVDEIVDKFSAAYYAEPMLATRALFYTGDVRGGLGERRTFRTCLKWLATFHPTVVHANVKNIAHYNRWDSMFVLEGTPVENEMWSFIEITLKNDLVLFEQKKPITLLAKWMPSINTSSENTRRLAKKAIQKLGIRSEKHYRKMLSMLREYLNVTEHHMSAQDWEKIDYEKVPSYAMSKYSRAFFKHDGIRFNSYKNAVQKGTAKVNAAVLYPYDLTHNYMFGSNTNLMAEEQWKALPNYVDGNNNILIMADVSGSMCGRPMETSVGLAIYFAERNHGDFANLYMTFTDQPHYVKINPNDTLEKKCWQVRSTDVGYNTNLAKAFDYVLKTAKKGNVPAEDMPKAIVVISDMEIDGVFAKAEGRSSFWGSSNKYSVDFVDEMEKRFMAAGYQMPKLVLWNVESRKDTYLTQNKNVLLYSGQSASTFKNLISSLTCDAYEAMVKTLMSERYNEVMA